jgi:ribosomal protein S18 acetylase RimI-like enzyme
MGGRTEARRSPVVACGHPVRGPGQGRRRAVRVPWHSLVDMLIRQFRESDRTAVIDLWRRAGLVRPWNDPDRDIDRKVADSPWGLLVGVPGPDVVPAVGTEGEPEPDGPHGGHGFDPDRVVAAMMVGYDGHRGSVFYLAVDPDWRGRGFATALMAHAEELLLSKGCPKVSVSVRSDNSQVIGFYADRGYRIEGPDHAVTLGLRLVEDGPGPA